jgi:Ser/Thr protein kinase RdoA (MazF antagonist)
MQARLGEGPGVFGLIQADTNLTNVKFGGLRVGLLDFEVCCYGYFLFDVTRALLELARMPGGAALEAAFLAGYQRGMPIPEPRAEALAAFKLMNLVDIASWALSLPPDSGVRGADALLERTLREVRAAI